jgi:hypothetical protein
MYSLHPIMQDVIITSIVLYGTEGVLKSQKLIFLYLIPGKYLRGA